MSRMNALWNCKNPYQGKYNPENGWGDYEGLHHFVHNYWIACCEEPNAEIGVWR